MKKVTFCTYDSPSFFGPNTSLRRLLPGLKTNGFNVEVLIFYEGALEQCETYKHFLKYGIIAKIFPYQSIAEDKINWILTILSKEPPSVFVSYLIVHSMYACKWLKEAGIPTIGCIHSDDRFYEGIIDVFVKGAPEYHLTAIVSCSEYLDKKIKKIQPTELVTRFIPYGVPVEGLPTANFDKKEFSLIYVGRLVEKQKRISEVVKSFCLVANREQNIAAVIYGNGDKKKVLRLIKKYSNTEKVKYGGTIDNNIIFENLSQSQVFVLLSDYEGLPQTLLEAMVCGLVPVCLNMKSGIPELIEQGHTGVIVNDRKASFIKAIQELSNNRELCKKIGANAKEKVIQSYSISKNIEEWTALIHMLADANPKPDTLIVPKVLHLPKPHPYLKSDDRRRLNKAQTLFIKIEQFYPFKQTKALIKRILNR